MSRILLIGPPGAGKSTVGAALSVHLSRSFLDTDALIVEKSGKSITDIFVVEGEAAFRALEFETLAEVLLKDDVVVSLGGGAPVSEAAQEAISQSGSQVVFLDVLSLIHI